MGTIVRLRRWFRPCWELRSDAVRSWSPISWSDLVVAHVLDDACCRGVGGSGSEKRVFKVTSRRFGEPLPDGAIAGLGTVRWRYAHPVELVQFIEDDKKLLTCCGDGLIQVTDTISGKLIRRFGNRDGSLEAAALDLKQAKRSTLWRDNLPQHFGGSIPGPKSLGLADRRPSFSGRSLSFLPSA